MKHHVLITICLLGVLGLPAWASPLDDRIATFEAPATTQDQAMVLNILRIGVEEHRSAEALAAVQPWISRNRLDHPQALFYAGQASEESGVWLAAVGYYQRLLQSPNPDANLAGPAVDATYRLLLGPIGDDNAAYLYMRRDGNAIRGFGSARRYDRWFLEQATAKRDLVALALRLAAMAGDNSTQPATYALDLEWLCGQLEQFRKESPEVYAAALALAQAQRVPADIKARLTWVATVMPYNMQLDELRANNEPAPPELTNAPLAAATELLRRDPNLGALLVAMGWGVEYDGNHTGNCQRRFEIEGQRKLDQLLAVVPRMEMDRRDDLLSYPIANGRVRFDPAAVTPLMAANAQAYNALTAQPPRVFTLQTMTVEQARTLAPLLARNPHPEAALIRAIASSGSLEFGAVAQAMINSEMWRFAETRPALDLAWNSTALREADRNEVNTRFAQMPARYGQIKQQIAAEANTQQRQAAFNALRNDLLSNSPSIPGAMSLWSELFANSPDAETAQMLQTLTGDLTADREYLLRTALGTANFGDNNAGRFAWQAVPHSNHYAYHRQPARENAAELIAHLQGMVEQQMRAGEINQTIFGMWVHSVDTQDASARELIQTLAALPAYMKLDRGYRLSASDSKHFGHIAMAPDQAATDPHHISRELLELADDATPAAVENALNAVMRRAASAPEPVTVIGLQRVAALETWSDRTRQHVLSLFRENAPLGAYPTRQGYEHILQHLSADLRVAQRWTEIEPYAAGLWHAAGAPDDARYYRGAEALTQLMEAAHQADALSAAISLARSAMASKTSRDMSARTEAVTTELLGRISQVMGRTSIALGIIDIPVDERDPAFVIYKSQAEFAIGNTTTAWQLYDEHPERIQPIVRQLTVPYCLWLLERDIEARESERAEALIRELTIWSREASGTFTSEQDGQLKIAYADAAFQRGALQTARAWYRRVADAEEYAGTPLQYEAMLRTVRVDRASRDFDSAIAELERLLQVRDDQLRIAAHFALAEVHFDQENYADAYAEVSIVLSRDPGHADALILLGMAQLQMRKLVDASEIELGVSQELNVIVPGEIVKVNLNDPALNVSGVGADIEVEVWTASGDREVVMLHQLGDDRTHFRAEIPTALAPRQPGDGILQVLGRDEIRYGYSQRFRQRMDDLPPDPDVVIHVASDARLSASAGAFPPREGERRLDLSELGISTSQQALGTRRVRPGNPVYLRVNDPDQSRTDEIDQIIVSVQTTNGDEIPRLVLTETGTHTGEFQATVQTGPAQALAFATESAPGRDPNMVISANAQYPGWSGAVGSQAEQQMFTIDLNDNVPLGTMNIQCDDPTQALTHFVVQTSMNGTDWYNRARFPQDPAPWSGQPQITVFPTYNRNSLPISAAEDRTVPEDWQQKMDIASARGDINYGAFTVPNISNLNLDLPSGGHPGYGVLLRYRAMFYLPAAAIRTFRLAGLPRAENTQTIFLIDGVPADADSDDAFTITRELRPGLHEIEVWRAESRGSLIQRTPQILSDVEGSDELAPCTDAMFDPQTFPQPVRDTISGPTTITAAQDQPNHFNIAFGDNARARLVRLAIVGHEGTAPTINKITMTDGEGEPRLPVATDYQTLRSNDQLEVVPGDQISVRFEDDLFVSPRNGIRQARLAVAFNTATITSSFVIYEITDEGRELVLEPIRRFEISDGRDREDSRDIVGIFIEDPDMDQTAERDMISFTVRTSDGEPVTYQAQETKPHSGLFLGTILPVIGEPQNTGEIQVRPGAELIATYRDEENLDPGIPTDRVVTVEHAQFNTPTMGIYNVTSSPLPPPAEDANAEEIADRGPEIIVPRRALSFEYADQNAVRQQAPRAVVGSSLRFDVLASHLAYAQSSEIVAYVQTESGRQTYTGPENNAPFNPNVPGTLRLSAHPARSASTLAPPGYIIDSPGTPPNNTPALDEGRFAFSVPIILDDPPLRSFATEEAMQLPSSMLPDGLAVRPGDTIYIGYAYLDPQRNAHWIVNTVQLDNHAILDVMNGRYRQDIRAAYIGESMFIRLIAPEHDTTPERDVTNVRLTTESGVAVNYQLRESEVHSGVFRGSFELSYAEVPADADASSIALRGLPVRYGDRVTVAYPGSSSDGPPAISIAVNMGADGMVEPFSKQYSEGEMAVQTTFTLAECFFELARHHSEMGQESLARRELAHARKLLTEALETHRDEEMQAHAEYLLANLSQEFADLAENDEASRALYQDALGRFSRIVLEFPDSEFAPMAQFKKALVYERLGEIDIAVEEYVKLAYKYPDHELIPSVMSRLGSYFQDQGLTYKTEAEALEERVDDTDAQGEAIRLRELASQEYLNAAQVFAKLQERFPTDPLAGLAGLRSAQNFMRAGDYEQAIAGFQIVIDTEQYDGRTIRSQAVYWSAISHERLEDIREAYQLYRRITFDFPDSIWAKRARGRLSDPVFAEIIRQEEQARELMLEGLREQR